MSIGVVLVTYNRLEKLKTALNCYDMQTESPEYVLVINNHSNDGTEEYLKKWSNEKAAYRKIVSNLPQNTGGSGGFYEGLRESLDLEADWVWVADDDAFPEKNCFEVANDYLSKHTEENISAICGKVVNRGKIDRPHRRRIKNVLSFPLQTIPGEKNYEKPSFDIQLFSYVGTIISKEKMKQVGVTKKDYFIYNDDSEHSYRLSKVGRIICIPKIVIVHDGPQIVTRDGVTWKLYYAIRNVLDMVKSNWPENYYHTYRVYVRIKYTLILLILYRNKRDGFNILRKAISDADNGKLGLDTMYHPGWKPGKKNS
jgi:GT2 family glycosyltransferase